MSKDCIHFLFIPCLGSKSFPYLDEELTVEFSWNFALFFMWSVVCMDGSFCWLITSFLTFTLLVVNVLGFFCLPILLHKKCIRLLPPIVHIFVHLCCSSNTHTETLEGGVTEQNPRSQCQLYLVHLNPLSFLCFLSFGLTCFLSFLLYFPPFHPTDLPTYLPTLKNLHNLTTQR
ncbi:hypothetical protein B296_00044076 [Ensete ventricosum]|uniref:Uncharacterized protein n=1 Tax=Ensete ventricosum TaxID=4639 RepID=A0A426XME9_ENSVE|nr:hypothetical protein B296_00044076 [Ensete ventricosum]